MNFQPQTTIWFCHTGITADNKVECKTEDEVFEAVTREGNVWGRMTNCSFQRADGFFTIRVDHSAVPYYLLMQCDTVIYKNEEQSAAFWIVGNVISVEWKNEDCSFVHFAIDPFMTFQPFIDFEHTYAYVKREHVKDDWSAEGGNPLFSNIGPAEDFGTMADNPVWSKNFKSRFNRVLIQSPYDDAGKPMFDGTIEGGMYTGLRVKTCSVDEANTYFNTIAESKDASINNIVGVYAIDDEIEKAFKIPAFDKTDDIPAFHIAAKTNKFIPDYNNAKCWSSPFCNIRLMASTGDHCDFTPQWFGSDVDTFTLTRRVRTAGGQFGAMAATFINKNGTFNWNTWNDFIVMITDLPRCPWTADGFTDWASYSTIPLALQGVAGIAKTIASFAGTMGNPSQAAIGRRESIESQAAHTNMLNAGRIAGGIAVAAQETADFIAPIMQKKATGATVNGGGSYSGLFDIGSDEFGFKVIYYMAQPYVMNSVDQYFDRFGYLINRLKKLEIKNRPIWTYVQTAECHIAQQKTGGIPYLYETAINNMFNSGVTIWAHDKYMGGRLIGDFSNAKENKGIQGAL